MLVPDSCRATERNGSSISADDTDDALENEQSAIFREFGCCCGLFDIAG